MAKKLHNETLTKSRLVYATQVIAVFVVGYGLYYLLDVRPDLSLPIGLLFCVLAAGLGQIQTRYMRSIGRLFVRVYNFLVEFPVKSLGILFAIHLCGISAVSTNKFNAEADWLSVSLEILFVATLFAILFYWPYRLIVRYVVSCIDRVDLEQ